MRVNFLGSDEIRNAMNDERKKHSKKCTIFVQEEVVQDEETLRMAGDRFNCNIQCSLLTFDEVVPLGFSAENAITCLKN